MNISNNLNDRMPFFVYATDGPVYHHFDGNYGKHRNASFSGTFIILSGGLLQYKTKNQCSVVIEGCLCSVDRVGGRFVEQAIPEMVSPDSRLVLLYSTIRDEAKYWLSEMVNAGFDVICNKNNSGEYNGDFAICTGLAWMLGTIKWMSQVRGFEPFLILVNKGAESNLEKMMIKAIHDNTSPVTTASSVISEISSNSNLIQDMLCEYELISWIADSHMTSLFINSRSHTPEDVARLFGAISRKLNVMLFHAPILDIKNNNKSYFASFNEYEKQQPLPMKWRQENKPE